MLKAIDRVACRAYIRFLILNGSINSRDRFGCTELMYIVEASNTLLFKLFIEAGANLDLVDRHGYTALMYAAKCSTEIMVKSLIEAGALDFSNNASVLMLAIRYNANKNVLQFLINATVDNYCQDEYTCIIN